MKKFVKTNPDYTKEIIIRATKDYLNHLRMNNFAFIQASRKENSSLGAISLSKFSIRVGLLDLKLVVIP